MSTREPTDWLTQARKGVLEMCVLGLIANDPRYGYDIVQELAADEALASPGGTVYPLLRRLKHDGLVESYWEPSESGPPRQYYRITPNGRRAVSQMARAW